MSLDMGGCQAKSKVSISFVFSWRSEEIVMSSLHIGVDENVVPVFFVFDCLIKEQPDTIFSSPAYRIVLILRNSGCL